MGLLKRRIIEPQEEPPMANTVDTDIVESLRYVAQSAKPVDAGQMRAAADEIERLRAEVERLRQLGKRNAEDLREYAAVLAGEMADLVADECKITVKRMF